MHTVVGEVNLHLSLWSEATAAVMGPVTEGQTEPVVAASLWTALRVAAINVLAGAQFSHHAVASADMGAV